MSAAEQGTNAGIIIFHRLSKRSLPAGRAVRGEGRGMCMYNNKNHCRRTNNNVSAHVPTPVLKRCTQRLWFGGEVDRGSLWGLRGSEGVWGGDLLACCLFINNAPLSPFFFIFLPGRIPFCQVRARGGNTRVRVPKARPDSQILRLKPGQIQG